MPAAAPVVLSGSMEDYIKAIHTLTAAGQPATTSDLSHRLGVTPGSVSTMLKRMDTAGLVTHVPYRGVHLTDDGAQLALGVIRRHRLLELFLATSLDIPWEDVHRFADALEHAASDELIDRIADKLGDPLTDPHGDPIPNRALQLAQRPSVTLADLQPGNSGTIIRVSDSDPEMLRYLTVQGIAIGDQLEVTARQPFDGPCEIRIGTRTHTIGINLADAIHVET